MEEYNKEIIPGKYNLSLNEVLSGSFKLWFRIIFLGIFSMLFTYSLLSLSIITSTRYLQLSETDAEFFSVLSNYFQDMNPGKLNNFETSEKLMNVYYNYLSNSAVLLRFAIVILVKILIYPLSAGITYCAYAYDQTGEASFKDLITGFSGKRFLNLIGLNFIYLIAIAVSAGFIYFPMLFLAPLFFTAGALIIIHDISLIKAVKYSLQTAASNFMPILSVCLISFLLGTVLSILLVNFYVFVFTIPFSYVLVYTVYKNTLGTILLNDKNNSDSGSNNSL